MLKEKLNKAYPYRGNFTDSVSTFLFISCFITVFVFLFRADQIIPNSSYAYRLLVSLLYGLATFGGASLNALILYFFNSNKFENDWKVWKEILLYMLHFFTISILLYFLKGLIIGELSYYSHVGLFNSFLRTIATGIIPVTIHVLYDQNKLFKAYYTQATALEAERVSREVVEQKESIDLGEQTVLISDILYIESKRNYLDLYLMKEDKITVRKTLKEIEEKLEKFQQFIHCHRAYIINGNKVDKIDGNAQGLKLTIQGASALVPVSRTYIPKISQEFRLN